MPVTANFTQRLFHEYFPPPRFLEMPAVGLTISDDAVSAIELVRRRDAYAVGRFGRRPLLKESIMGGYVNDKDAVVGEPRKLKNELKLDFVDASLSEEKAYLFQTSIPKVSYMKYAPRLNLNWKRMFLSQRRKRFLIIRYSRESGMEMKTIWTSA